MKPDYCTRCETHGVDVDYVCQDCRSDEAKKLKVQRDELKILYYDIVGDINIYREAQSYGARGAAPKTPTEVIDACLGIIEGHGREIIKKIKKS